MLDTLINSKTRLKLLLRFFLNPESKAYLRGLEQEFNENSNSIRIELNRFEQAGLINATKDGNKKVYHVNPDFPIFDELQSLAFKHFGIDKILDQVVSKLGKVSEVFVTGKIARGLDTSIIDLVFIGEDLDVKYIAELSSKLEKKINRKVRTLVFSPDENPEIPEPNILIFNMSE